MKPLHEMTIAEAAELAQRREANRRAGRPLDCVGPSLATAPDIVPEVRVTGTLERVNWAGLADAGDLAIGVVTPVRLRVPWSYLVSDNAKSRAAIRWVNDTPHPNVVLTAEYRRCRDAIKRRAVDVMAGRMPLAAPLALVARVWVPDNRPRDVVNFSKALHDALQGVVYTDDRWLYDVRWIRAGVDVDAPRAELTIAPLPVPTP